MKSDAVFVLENAGWPAMLLDGTGTILRANQAAVKIFGPVLDGGTTRLSALWTPDNGTSAEQFLALWERAPASRVSLKLQVRGGGTSVFAATLCAFSQAAQKFFIFQAPIETGPVDGAKSAADSGPAQKQKLDCALQLARTVSLDFNNALTGILCHTTLLLSQTPAEHPWRVSLLEVEKSAHRAAEVANDLAAFTRQESAPRGPAAGNLNTVVQSAAARFQNVLPGKIEWSLQWGRQLFAVRFDESKMEQALVKLFDNAVEALDGHGRITVQTRNLELTEEAQDRELRLASGTYVCVEISDSGCGIPPEVLPRVFEPFFTTKKRGGHRGLGLALVYGIVTNHAGGVAISSQPGIGTSVRVYLPAEKKMARETRTESSDLKGNQTVLLVDDEELMLTMGQTVLSAYGYRVLTASSGAKAVEILSQQEAGVDLVITDLVMPTMSGRELTEQVHQISPHTQVLCISGFVRPAPQADETGFLQKPFTSQDLLAKVKRALTPPTAG